VRHHEVVDRLYAECRELLPLSFGAIFRSAESLRQRLESQAAELQATLTRLAGKEEWDVKLSRDQAAFQAGLGTHSEDLRTIEREMATLPPGRAYMLRKKRENVAAAEAKRIGGGVREDVHRTLSQLASEAQRDRLVAAPLADVRLELRSAYLVEEANAIGLKLAAERLSNTYAPLGYSLDLSGPWPPFSFTGSLRDTLG